MVVVLQERLKQQLSKWQSQPDQHLPDYEFIPLEVWWDNLKVLVPYIICYSILSLFFRSVISMVFSGKVQSEPRTWSILQLASGKGT